MNTRRYIVSGMCITTLVAIGYYFGGDTDTVQNTGEAEANAPETALWVGPDQQELDTTTESGKLIAYGRDLLAHTAKYFGPKGSVRPMANGLNCQNCHLEGGTKPWGNNYGAVYSTYPRLRSRSGEVEDIYRRINDCFERSMNGEVLDTTSREVRALYAYFKWVGKEVPHGVKPPGAGLRELTFLDRPADTLRGKAIYIQKCQLCHGPEGKGQLNEDGKTYLYPPLWGEDSYTTAAGMYRLTKFAGYVYDNMPFGSTWQARQLTEEEAWDVAAFVNSRPRPVKTFSGDWPDISLKPIDAPFGPYADPFTEEQHKFGPFGPIAAFYEESRTARKSQ